MAIWDNIKTALSDITEKTSNLVTDAAPSVEALSIMEKVQEEKMFGATITQVSMGSVGEVRTAEVGNEISDRVKAELADLNLDLLQKAGMINLANNSVESVQVASAAPDTNERQV